MKLRIVLLAVAVIAGLAAMLLPTPSVVADDCAALPSGAQLTVKLHMGTEGHYQIWIRQVTPATGNALFVSVDGSCARPIAKNPQSDKLSWSGFDINNQPLLYSLPAGGHTLVFAGDYTGIAVDRGLLTTDHACIPQEGGENCLNPEESAGEIIIVDEPVATSEKNEPGNKFGLALAIGSAAAIVAVIGFLVWHYLSFIKRAVLPALGISTPVMRKIKHVFSVATARHFFNHHRFIAIVYGGTLLIFAALFVLGVAVAQIHKAILFEAENGTVSGQAVVVADAHAASGSYVLFGGSAPVITGSEATSTTVTTDTSLSLQNNTGGGGGSGGNGGGGSGGGGGGNTPIGECPPFPAFPDENCTGWEHTGVTLTDCTDQTDNGYIWDGQQTTFDSCYFSKSLTIQAANVTITRSQVHGHISTHWSNTYDFRNLALRDVEIEQEGVEDINSAAVAGHNYSCTRCNVHHTLSGMHFGDNTTIRDSYTHDFQWRDGAHGAGIGAGQGHGSNSFIIHNNIQCNRISGPPICSSALSIYPEGPEAGDPDGVTVHNVQVEKNLFNATGAYCVYAGGLPATNINFIDNYFGKKFYPGCAGYGPVTAYQPEGGQWVGNVWADGSGPVVP